MIVSIHQPQYLPWLPYFDKVDHCDYFIYLDNVQYQRNGVQKRNKIKTSNGEGWLTVPVVKAEYNANISEVKINGNEYKKKHIKTLQRNYSKATYFHHYFEKIEKIINSDYQCLADLNIALSNWIMTQFQINTPTLKASKLNVVGRNDSLLLDICLKLKATKYLSGVGGKNYLDERKFIDNNIEVIYQNYCQKNYTQCWGKLGFIKNLSSIDLLFNEGPNNSRRILLSGRLD